MRDAKSVCITVKSRGFAHVPFKRSEVLPCVTRTGSFSRYTLRALARQPTRRERLRFKGNGCCNLFMLCTEDRGSEGEEGGGNGGRGGEREERRVKQRARENERERKSRRVEERESNKAIER